MMVSGISLKGIIAAMVLFLFLMPLAGRGLKAAEPGDEKVRPQELKKEAALNLWRLKKAVEEDGFYSARIALNVWRSSAIDAGTFDQAQYDEFKKKLYEKSIDNSLECVESFVQEEDYYDASMCLETWKIHSQEIGTYDPARYKELRERLKGLKTKKPSEEDEKVEKSD
jgi:hypothetical protein